MENTYRYYREYSLGSSVKTIAIIFIILNILCLVFYITIFSKYINSQDVFGVLIFIFFIVNTVLWFPLKNINKNTVLYVEQKISTADYQSKRGVCWFASIVLALSCVGILFLIPVWIFLSQTKYLLYTDITKNKDIVQDNSNEETKKIEEKEEKIIVL